VRAQSCGPVEIIVVDDASRDDTCSVAAESGADRIARLDVAQGPSMARNIGIALASGERITFLDATDRMAPGRLCHQRRWLDQHPHMAGVFADLGVEAGSGGLSDSGDGLPISVMLRVPVLLNHGGFDPRCGTAEDGELLKRLERGGARIGRLKEPLTVSPSHRRRTRHHSGAMWSASGGTVHQPAPSSPAPTISVLIPVFETRRYLAAAVESVLADALPGTEIVIVDDGSRDGSFDLALQLQRDEPSVRAVRQPHAGAGAARNLGLLLARGRYVAMLDADDLSMPGRFRSQLASLEDDPTIEFVFGGIEEFISDDSPPAVAARLRPRVVASGHGTSSLLARRAAMAEVGLFPAGSAIADWPEWYARAVDREVRMVSVPHVVARRRLHGANHSLVHDTARSQYLGILRRSLVRRSGLGS